MTTDAVVRIPAIETERLRLAPPALRHADDYIAFYGSDQATFLGGPKTPEDAWRGLAGLIGEWALRGYGRWIVEDKTSGAYLGHAGLHFPLGWPEPEITWSVVASAQGRGIAYEAAVASRRYAYGALGWRTAISLIAPGNARSIALAERLGARREAGLQRVVGAECFVYRHPGPDAGSQGSMEAPS